MAEPVNMLLSNGVVDADLASHLVKLLTGHETESVHPLDDSEGAGHKAMYAGGEGLAERPWLGAVSWD